MCSSGTTNRQKTAGDRAVGAFMHATRRVVDRRDDDDTSFASAAAADAADNDSDTGAQPYDCATYRRLCPEFRRRFRRRIYTTARRRRKRTNSGERVACIRFLSRNARKVCCVIHKKTRKSTSAQSNLAKVRIATNSYGSQSNIRQINKKFCYRRRTARRAMSVKNSTQVVQQIYNKSK